ncbi:GNAT family N-acetyltransferase [Salirhabdus salicampi]|uniref:GNAT family N-acetyltransferase n=1 Tax=Salirhabdus salicampi TaxID=476102 RepID=UPI0020C588C4|nr:GNAT family protein [Salirhabdus salicampi]MCP8618105.1 GNAT family N-acetyltransferase [Salirhabdus salicampi]
MFIFPVNQDIQLKLLERQDASQIFHLVDDNRHFLRKWLPWVDNMRSVEDYYPVIDMWLSQFANHNGFQVAILYNGHMAGMVGLHQIDWRQKQTTIGYWLGENYQGKGIMTKTVEHVVRYIFQELRLNRVEIRCGVHNYKSRAIPERLGFRQEGIIQDGERLYNYYHDIVIYGTVARDWLNQHKL